MCPAAWTRGDAESAGSGGAVSPERRWRPLAAVPILEEDYGKPVFTNDNTWVWRIIHDGHAPAVSSWERLLASP